MSHAREVAEGSETLSYEMEAGHWVACSTEDAEALEQEEEMPGVLPAPAASVLDLAHGSSISQARKVLQAF